MFLKGFLYISFTLLPLLVRYFIRRKYLRAISALEAKDTRDDYYYQCLFIYPKNSDCRQHIIDEIECSDSCSYKYLQSVLRFISSATSTISLCVLTLQIRNIQRELKIARKRGVVIRLILDEAMTKSDQLNFLENSGIKVRKQKPDGSIIHHKFCLIDEKDEILGKMFFGSLNLTMQGFVKNFEHLILTNNKFLIREFSNEFEQIWDALR